MPTFLVFKNGNVINYIRGANPPTLNAAVENISKAVASEATKAAKAASKEEPKSGSEADQETVSGSYGMTKGSGWKMSLK